MLLFVTNDALSMIIFCFFLMIRRPPRSTLDRSSAASDVYKRQSQISITPYFGSGISVKLYDDGKLNITDYSVVRIPPDGETVSYTHLRAHETVLDLVCRLLLEKKKKKQEIP